MGKFRSKLKGQAKGKRWPKGQSSSSNPETHKYRDLAKSRFFQENLGSSGLTSEALRKHDAVQAFKPRPDPEPMGVDEDVESSVGTYSSYKTMESFASEWSSYSNMSFTRFLKVFRADSALHKEMLAMLAAISEVIRENGGSETATEYYCSLITALERVYEGEERSEEQLTAALALLNMGIKTVPEPVLRRTFSDLSAKVLHILNDYVDSDNNTIVKSIFGILGTLLRKQELIVWTNEATVKIFTSMLNPFCLHTKPKWRKAAQQAVILVVKSDYFTSTNTNIAADKIAEFCEQTLDTCMGGNSGAILVSSIQAGQTTILHTLGLLKDTICCFSKSHMKKCCEIILRLMTLNYPIVTSCGLQVLHALFSAQTAVVPPKLNAQLISALYEYQPAAGDVQPTLAWLAVMQQAHVHLADVDLAASCAALPKIFATISQLWLSEKSEIMTAATHALENLLKDAVGPACATKEQVEQFSTKINKCFSCVEAGLGYQYHSVWHQVLHLIAVMFEVGGQNCSHMLLNCLKSLSELRDSYKFSYNNELEHAVGAAIRSMGPETVINVISLKKDNGDLNLDRSWMLPVLKENIKASTIEYFMKGILPLALYCQRRSAQLAEANDGIGAHSSELLYMQLWNLLPCFCNHPTDIKDSFKSVAKVLGTAISDRKELRLSVMASLRKLIASAKESENQDDIDELARFDKNYLPILFNVYTTKPMGSDEEGQRLAALDTIKVYLTIAKPELTQQLLTHAIERLNSSSEDPEDSFIKESILDLIRALVPYQDVENIKVLYEQCVKPLPEIKSNKEQKKAYRLLEEICGSESDSCKQFIKSSRKEVQALLWKALETAAVSSKGARLRCLNYLVKAQPQLDSDSKLIKRVVPEAVLSCKDINEKTRYIAYEVLNTVGETLQQHNQLDRFVAMVVGGLVGNVGLMSCSVLALASILHNFSGSLGQNNIQWILDKVTELMSAATRELVAACLSFVKVYCKSIPSPMVAASLPQIIKALCSMTDDCSRHFRLKIRDILNKLVRKYGSESIAPYIPESNTVMYKRLRNIRKLLARKKRQKEGQKEEDGSEDEEFLVKAKPKSVEEILADSDSETEDMETDHKVVKRKQPNTWIEEDPESIVDFTDPNVVSKITATQPGSAPFCPATSKKPKPEKDRGFKTAPDGRLIITDDDSSDSDSDQKKNKIDFDSDSDSEVDNKSVAETLVLSDRKRKRAASVKSGVSSVSQPPAKYKTGGIGIHRATSSASVRSGASSVPGSEYRGKRAKGDVKKKGKPDPYAYLPLRRSAINKRKKSKAAGQFKNIIRGAKAGALKGAKAKRNRNKN
ncbi:RRP12-like protein [Tribolium castaneum]|uniref:RRP12-like protein n=1 Tax=Tribolium castaneum TaxID=7070 RepID=D6WZI8_TRICA|nr:PREDICTED: RRP12-like protein [Tribolium castaneum]EFA09698.2 RRP12-like protein [Tribolium castaneum]|eukprot:XP_008198233.1 PREDICTED: RRP12-like protein [Tribolium castaneum]